MHGPTRPDRQQVEFEHGEATWVIAVVYEDESVDGPGWDWQGEIESAAEILDGIERDVEPRDVPDDVREHALELALEAAYW